MKSKMLTIGITVLACAALVAGGFGTGIITTPGSQPAAVIAPKAKAPVVVEAKEKIDPDILPPSVSDYPGTIEETVADAAPAPVEEPKPVFDNVTDSIQVATPDSTKHVAATEQIKG